MACNGRLGCSKEELIALKVYTLKDILTAFCM